MRARVWCSQGVLQCSLGNYTASRDAFDCAVREDSSQIRAWLNLGQLWENWFKIHGTPQEKAQSVRRARLAFWRAARINPDEEHALARLEALGGPPEEMSYTTSIASDEGFYSGQSAEEIPSAEEEPPDVQVRVSEAQDDVKHQEDHGESVTEEREVTPSGSSVSYESTASPEPPVPHSSPVPNPPIPHISAMTDQNAMEPNVESAVPQMPQPSELCESAPASSMPMPDFVCEPDEQHMAGPSPPDYHTSRILDAIARVESNQRQIQQQLESLTTVTNGALSRLERLESSVNEQQPLADDRPYNVRVSALELQLLECGGGHAAFGRAAMEAAREAAHTTPSREQDVRRLINRYGCVGLFIYASHLPY